MRLQKRTSYRIIGTSRHISYINTNDILAIINKARRNIKEPLMYIPSDLRTPDEMAGEIDGIKPKDLKTWVQRRTKNVPPHFRFNKHTTRFSAKLLKDWIDNNTHIREAKK